MIKHIHARGRYMQILGGNSSTYINGQYGAQGVGNYTRWHGPNCKKVK